MKKITAETTRYMMDAMAYAYVAAVTASTGKEPTAQEIDYHVRAMMALYCRHEKITPDYEGIASLFNYPDYDDEIEYDDEYEDDDEEDDDEENPLMNLVNLIKTLQHYVEDED